MDIPRDSKDWTKRGRVIYSIGWLLCISSICFALGMKSRDPSWIPLGVSVAVLVVGLLIYLICWSCLPSWRSKEIRLYFSPYIVGATIWILLFVLGRILFVVTEIK